MTVLDTSNTKSLADRILESMKRLAPLLVPPFEQVPSTAFDEFVASIRAETGAEAVSIFLVSEDDPNLLICRAAEGYKRSYRGTQYFINGMYLTSHVCRQGQAINASRKKLEQLQKDKKLPYTGRCEEFIGSSKFFNIVAVPILFEDKNLGVLKLENKSRDSNEPFPEEDFDLARTLGSIIGVAYQQRLSATLWNEGERIRDSSRSVESYVQNVTAILTKRLNAQCASVFIRDQSSDGKQILRYGGGVGYEEGYKAQIYQLEPGSSLTSYIFKQNKPLCMTEKKILQSDELPYTGACSSNIKGGFFRNILAFPLRIDESDCLGVLKIENKLPGHAEFDSHDMNVTEAFVKKQIVPTLAKLVSKQGSARLPTPGYVRLEAECGPSVPSTRDELLKRAKKVQDTKDASETQITTGDCAKYLQISKPHYFRVIKRIN